MSAGALITSGLGSTASDFLLFGLAPAAVDDGTVAAWLADGAFYRATV
jgi:hypothetical protein